MPPVDTESVCPFLGLPDDPQSHFSFPEGAHVCRAKQKPAPIDLAYQASFCLGRNYPACARFKTATRPVPVSPTAIPAAQASAAASKGGEPKRRGVRWYLLRVVGAVVIIGVLTTMAAVIVLSLHGSGGAQLTPEPIDTPLAVIIDSPTPTTFIATPTPTLEVSASPSTPPTPTPTPSPSLVPTPSPSATPTPTPTPTPTWTPVVHVVVRGETLGSIARLYSVTPQSIVDLNGIHDPNKIQVGWELLILAQ